MCASRMVPKPNFIPKLRNRSIREIPVTISAFSIGIFVIPMRTARLVRFMDCMAMQAIVPMRVAISADKIASASVFHKACMICSFRNKAAYHLVVKPPHFARVLLALKESTIKVIMGAYKKIKISPRYIFCAVVLIIMCSPPLLYP